MGTGGPPQEGAAPRLVVISPGRDEAKFVRRTLDSVIAQSRRPDLWLIVDDGSTDRTVEIVERYLPDHPWIRLLRRGDRGHRAVGPGVVDAFYAGLAEVALDDFDVLAKLDLDLDLPERYFETILQRMLDDPRIGTCSGKPYFETARGEWQSEKCGDEMSAGMTKFWRVSCFEDIGGLVRQVMWDAIDCHKARQNGWIARSWDEPDLRFKHLRPMGSSGKGVLHGRMRHGFGQYFMGSDPLYFLATAVYRMTHPPYVLGGLAMIWGYARAWARSEERLADPELVRFIRSYQRRALLRGKMRAIEGQEAERRDTWVRRHAGSGSRNGAAARRLAT